MKAAIGGPPASGGAPVAIGNSGTAAIINVAERAAVADDFTQSDFTLPFNQVIPRPICNGGPTDYVLVQDPDEAENRAHCQAGDDETHALSNDIPSTRRRDANRAALSNLVTLLRESRLPASF